MTMLDHLKKAVETTLRESLPGNDHGSPAGMRIEHSGSIKVCIEFGDAPAVHLPCQCAARPVPQTGVDELLARLNAIVPKARTYERRAAGGRMVLHPAPWVRSMLKGQP